MSVRLCVYVCVCVLAQSSCRIEWCGATDDTIFLTLLLVKYFPSAVPFGSFVSQIRRCACAELLLVFFFVNGAKRLQCLRREISD